MPHRTAIPRPSLARLPIYYRRLLRHLEQGEGIISSQELGTAAGVPAAQVRKDLSHLGELGRAGVGYETRELALTLEDFMGLAHTKIAVLVGVGNLGRALAAYAGFERYGLHIVALFDHDPEKVGKQIAGKPVFGTDQIAERVQSLGAEMGIITVPAVGAQDVADEMVNAGIDVIWNFAPRALIVPDHVILENEDLAARLATISYHVVLRRLET